MWDLSSLTRNWTNVPCLARQSLSRWPTRDVPRVYFRLLLPSVVCCRGPNSFRWRGWCSGPIPCPEQRVPTKLPPTLTQWVACWGVRAPGRGWAVGGEGPVVQKAGNGVDRNQPFGAVRVPRGLVGPSRGCSAQTGLPALILLGGLTCCFKPQYFRL